MNLDEAKDRLRIPGLWAMLHLPSDCRKNPCHSPFYEPTSKPSFSVFNDGRNFKDQRTGEKGSAVDFLILATALSRSAACVKFVELAGDRKFMNDDAILGGLARFRGKPVVVLGHEKGRDTQTRLKHNFGMGKPEGYRKAVRLLELAGRFNLPVIALVDTSGAFPGKGGEERGQAEALARSIEACLTLDTPMISVIVGEGGSGGAVALASGNKVLMMEHAIYSVISPEGAASILFRDAKRSKDTAEAMKITAQDLLKFKIVDGVVPEPMGGAHRDPRQAIQDVGDALEKALATLSGLTPDDLRAQRKERFYAIGREGLA